MGMIETSTAPLRLPRRWWLAPLMMLVAIAVAAGYTLNQVPVYRASAKILIGQGDSLFAPERAPAVEPFTQTMSELFKSDVVARGTIERLQLDIEPAALLAHLQVRTKPETAVLDVSYDNTDRVRGRRILAAVTDVFTQLVNSRTPAQAAAGPSGSTVAAASATVFDPAHFDPGQVSPKPTLTIGVAAGLGLVLGLLVVLLQAQLDRGRRVSLRPLAGDSEEVETR